MWEITVKSQIITFLCGILLGVILSFDFDLFRALRNVLKHNNVVVFFEDILFFLVAIFTTFLLLMARCNGEVRMYVILSIITGFFMYRISLSKLFLPIIKFIFGLFVMIFKNIGNFAIKLWSYVNKFAKNDKKER